MRRILPIATLLLALAPSVHATAPAAVPAAPAAPTGPTEPPQMLAPVVVSGSLPGPGLWKATRDGHTLWILGMLTPLPRRMEWDSAAVEYRIGQSQRVIGPPGAHVKADVGFFRGMTLLPAALRARKLPDNRRLQDVLPPEVYARWQRLKALHIGRDRGVERWRPWFAAMELYRKALRKAGLRHAQLGERIERLRERADVALESPRVLLRIEDPKAALQTLTRSTLDDLDCFVRMLDRVEFDLPTMRERATAWSTGDIATLRSLPDHDPFEACADVLLRSALAEQLDATDLPERVRRQWLDTADATLAAHPVGFAMLPMDDLLQPDGLLAALAARGVTITAPDADEADAADDADGVDGVDVQADAAADDATAPASDAHDAGHPDAGDTASAGDAGQSNPRGGD